MWKICLTIIIHIKVFGGSQKRPNIHIDDVTDLYVRALEWPDQAVAGNIFNAGYDNQSLMGIAEAVKQEVGHDVEISSVPTDDLRSYHISSRKIQRELGFAPQYSIQHGVRDLVSAFESGKIPDSMDDIRYYNIKTMQTLSLK